MSCWLVCLVGWWLPACLGARALVGSWLVVTCMPWSLCPAGWCLVGSWLVCPLLMYLGARALVVGVLGRFVVGGYLHALELVPWWLVLGGGYLHALELVPWWLVCLVGSWLPAYLGACALVVGWWLVASWLVVTCMPLSLCLGNFFRPRKVCSLVCGYLHALELVPWWLVCLVVVTYIPWSSCLGGWCLVGSWVVTCMPWSLCFLKGFINFIYTNN